MFGGDETPDARAEKKMHDDGDDVDGAFCIHIFGYINKSLGSSSSMNSVVWTGSALFGGML